ncbi:TRAP transporter, 4TM/12TM fusion protein [Clostridium aceticum]|uniref:TRAP transporter, 4TM/12TM fusion protein n=1 Tax=Clostridium aceticum TaxID=84022 RepID=A0A0D8IEF1_9CLOT|nr:TRAP transporter fused permease subunit [Clostridium aceticum]AKL93893.1 TRAP transporter, 4TM/12TM fusion protein [Clostridium aceticum]KJF28715.1 C4-dicarboxylate ABC transporter permease [Clostridium aceticum]
MADKNIEEQQQELLEKYDSESRFRVFKNKNTALFIKVFAILIGFYHLYVSYFGTLVTLKHRSLHVAGILALTYFLYPAHKNADRKKMPMYDWFLGLLSISTTVYIFMDYLGIVHRAGLPNNLDLFFGVVLIVLVLEAARRVTGFALPLLGVLFIAYALFGRQMPGFFGHRGYGWTEIVNHLFVSTDGIYGTAVGVASTYIFLFILFGAFMGKSGMGQFFNDISLALAGHTKGGPAKVAVIASGFLGSINGAAVANVVTTGAFTIPLMKRTGYDAEFAGAVEASASVGGQLLPPIMGAAAFIMAEVLGIQYKVIVMAAILPALLYYLGIMTQVQMRASKKGLEGLPKSQLPKVRDVMKERGHLLLPLLFLMYMLFFTGKTIIYSAFWTIIVTIGTSMLRPTTRMSLKDIIDAVYEGTRSVVPVAIACAAVGPIVGVTSITGFGLNMAHAIVSLGGTSLLFTLMFTMVTCIILGMGLPSIPAYLITATIAAPALVRLGIEPIVAHLFVFYFAMFANITPPVALASFAAAGISGGNPMKTGFESMKLSIAGFIVPYMFVYNSALLLRDTTFIQGTLVTLTSIIGVIMLGSAAEGYFFTSMKRAHQLVLFAGAMMLISANLLQDVVGLVIIVVILVLQWSRAKKQNIIEAI